MWDPCWGLLEIQLPPKRCPLRVTDLRTSEVCSNVEHSMRKENLQLSENPISLWRLGCSPAPCVWLITLNQTWDWTEDESVHKWWGRLIILERWKTRSFISLPDQEVQLSEGRALGYQQVRGDPYSIHRFPQMGFSLPILLCVENVGVPRMIKWPLMDLQTIVIFLSPQPSDPTFRSYQRPWLGSVHCKG